MKPVLGDECVSIQRSHRKQVGMEKIQKTHP